MRKLLSRFRYHILVFFAVIGPGFITAKVDNDSGGIFTYSAAGARCGYLPLWTLLPITLVSHHHAGDVLAHGRGHGQGPLRPDPRRVRPAHHVPHDDPAGAGQHDQRDGGIRRRGQFARTVSRQPLHLGAHLGRGSVVSGGERQLQERRKDFLVWLRPVRYVHHLGLPGKARLERSRHLQREAHTDAG